MRNSDDSPPAVIDRVADILDEFRGGGHLTLSELSGRTGLPRSSVHRLLTQLVDAGWVRREARTYALGRSMFEWGALAQHHDDSTAPRTPSYMNYIRPQGWSRIWPSSTATM